MITVDYGGGGGGGGVGCRLRNQYFHSFLLSKINQFDNFLLNFTLILAAGPGMANYQANFRLETA